MVLKFIKSNPHLLTKTSSVQAWKYYNFFFLSNKKVEGASISRNNFYQNVFTKIINFDQTTIREYMLLKYLTVSFSRFLLWANNLPFYRILLISNDVSFLKISKKYNINLLKFFSLYSRTFLDYFLLNKIFIKEGVFKKKNLPVTYVIETHAIIFKNILMIKNLNS
jgi:hypothetical protein